MSKSSYLSDVLELSNGEIVTLGCDDYNYNIYVNRHDRYGNLIQSKTLSNTYTARMQASAMSDGSFLCNNAFSSYIMKLNSFGEVEFELEPFAPSFGVSKYSRVIDSESFYVLGSCNGSGTVWPSDTRLIELNKDGSGGYFYYIEDEIMGGKLLSFFPTRVYNDTTWAVGHMFPGGFVSWKGNMVLYSAKFHPKLDSVEVNLIDESFYGRERINGVSTDDDGNMYCVTTHSLGGINSESRDLLGNSDLLRLTKFNSQLQKVWSKKISLDLTKLAVTDLRVTNANTLMITGFCIQAKNAKVVPLLVELDLNGNVLMQKTYQLNGASGFNSSVLTSDQSLLLTGFSSGFGTAMAQRSGILMKTNLKGELE